MVEFYWAPKAYLTHRTSRDSRLISSISVYKKDLIPTVIERSEIAKWHGKSLISDQDASNFVYKTKQLT